MVYEIFRGYDTAGKPVFEYACNCAICRSCTSPCWDVLNWSYPSVKKTFTLKIMPPKFSFGTKVPEIKVS